MYAVWSLIDGQVLEERWCWFNYMARSARVCTVICM